LPFRDGAQASRCSHQGWAQTADRKARTEAGRIAALAKFLREVDPDGVMSDADRLKAAENARKAHLKLAAEKSVASRKRKKAKREAQA
jgi:hypothetical protein